MKKPYFSILLAVTFLFAGFLLGFLFARNQSRGDVIVSVPKAMVTTPEETTTPILPPETTEAPVVFPININTADKALLMELPNVGDVLSDRILAYREENGAFGHVTDLMNVEGIGQTRMEQLLDLVTIGG